MALFLTSTLLVAILLHDYSLEKDMLSLKVLVHILYSELDQSLKSWVSEKDRILNLVKSDKNFGDKMGLDAQASHITEGNFFSTFFKFFSSYEKG